MKNNYRHCARKLNFHLFSMIDIRLKYSSPSFYFISNPQQIVSIPRLSENDENQGE